MLKKFKDPLYRLRAIALIEGFSFIFLLFVSVPLKYFMGMADFSFTVGLTHGYLFLTYIILAIDTLIRRRINGLQFAFALLVSIIPFGTFYNEPKLKRLQEQFA